MLPIKLQNIIVFWLKRKVALLAVTGRRHTTCKSNAYVWAFLCLENSPCCFYEPKTLAFYEKGMQWPENGGV